MRSRQRRPAIAAAVLAFAASACGLFALHVSSVNLALQNDDEQTHRYGWLWPYAPLVAALCGLTLLALGTGLSVVAWRRRSRGAAVLAVAVVAGLVAVAVRAVTA